MMNEGSIWDNEVTENCFLYRWNWCSLPLFPGAGSAEAGLRHVRARRIDWVMD